MTELRLELPPGVVEAIAARAAEIVLERLGDNGRSPWLTVAEAAEHLHLPRQQLYKLTGARRVPFRKVGRRILLHRGELDAWLDGYREGRP